MENAETFSISVYTVRKVRILLASRVTQKALQYRFWLLLFVLVCNAKSFAFAFLFLLVFLLVSAAIRTVKTILRMFHRLLARTHVPGITLISMHTLENVCVEDV